MKHRNILCDACQQHHVTGIRWKCSQCHDYDLCTQCYNAGKHSVDHAFNRIDHLMGKPMNLMPPRKNARQASAMGLFQGATVVRGHDWKWKDQDGGPGKAGVLQVVQGWEGESENTRNAARVKWNESNHSNIYRMCFKGEVDLKCTTAGSGGKYYPEHLPVLGTPYQPALLSKPVIFNPNDFVKVKVTLVEFKKLQVGHGGWADQMSEVMDHFGKVTAVTDTGDLKVMYPSSRVWNINAVAVTKVPIFSPGDVVRVIENVERVRNLQKNHGDWTNEMKSLLGQLGRVETVLSNGDAGVKFKNKTWRFNPYCLTRAPGESVPDSAATPERGRKIQVVGPQSSLMAFLGTPLLLGAASAGDVDAVRSMLEMDPQIVNAMLGGHIAIHCAAMGGHAAVLEVLISYKANLEIGDKDGDKALHLCAYADRDKAAKILMDAGANVNSRNKKERTPLIIAAYKKAYGVLKLLAAHPNIQVNLKDSSGDTALHCAVYTRKIESVMILLDAKADPAISNAVFFTPIHTAARKGFLLCMKELVSRYPQHINLMKEDGYTALHLAALNDNYDTLTVLERESTCDLNAKNNKDQTALHLAAYKCHPRIVESLVGYGAALGVQDSNGNTPLHFIFLKRTAFTFQPCSETPQLNKVCNDYHIPPDSGWAVIACFLIQEGADTVIRNIEGNTPIQKCPPDIAEYVTAASKAKGSASFRGSLRGTALQQKAPLQHMDSAPNKDVKIDFSDLEFGEKVGSGGFGTVFKGRWKSKGLNVAIKRLSNQMQKEEAEILRQLNHPNIIEFYGDAVGENSQYVIITAFADSGSLYDFIHTKQMPVDHEQKMQWAREVAKGMKYLHEREIVHRDLKSSNVLLTADLVTKICDFGAAKEFLHTTVQTTTGTIIWIAPEILKGDPSSLSCDVYSYGMVLYEIFTYKIPFDGVKTAFQIGALKVRGEIPAIPSGLESDLSGLMKMCWKADPKARPSFNDIVAVLDKKDVKIDFSDLEFGEKVGSGDFGTVFKGHWRPKGLLVAIKRFSRQIQEEEIVFLSQLNHPNIIQFYGGAIGKHSQYVLVTAFAEGGSIYDFLHINKTCIGNEQKIQWAREIAQGMKYLHQRNIIHRDLKSSNVLLTANLATKICDISTTKENIRTAATRAVIWHAPEVLNGDPVSLTCDVYSYGMILYEISTCKLPFDGVKTAFQIGALKLGGEVPSIPHGCETTCARLMQMCWKIDPKARPHFHEIVTRLDKEEVKIDFSELEFGEEIGSGGFGTVFKGHWKPKRLDVAIKRFSKPFRKEEIEILNQLDHPNIITFYGVAFGKHSQYVIVTAFAKGGSMYDFIHVKKTCVGHDQKVKWAREIAQGMKYVHQKEVVHKDLKSSNVLLTDDMVTKICDFSSAKEVFQATVETTAGTVTWLAPEVLKGDPSSLSCDVYSYGMVLYEIFTCKLPFYDVKTAFQIGALKLKGEVPLIPDTCETSLASLMHMCWRSDPEARPSFHEITTILEKEVSTSDELALDHDDSQLPPGSPSSKLDSLFGDKDEKREDDLVFLGETSKKTSAAKPKLAKAKDHRAMSVCTANPLSQASPPHATSKRGHLVDCISFTRSGEEIKDHTFSASSKGAHMEPLPMEQKSSGSPQVSRPRSKTVGLGGLFHGEPLDDDLFSTIPKKKGKDVLPETVSVFGGLGKTEKSHDQDEPRQSKAQDETKSDVFVHTSKEHVPQAGLQDQQLTGVSNTVSKDNESVNTSEIRVTGVSSNLITNCSGVNTFEEHVTGVSSIDASVATGSHDVNVGEKLCQVDSQEQESAEVLSIDSTDSYVSTSEEHISHHIGLQDEQFAADVSDNMTADGHSKILREPELGPVQDKHLRAKRLTLEDLPKLKTKLQTVAGLWYPLGMQLGIQPNTLSAIPKVAGNDSSRCLVTLLTGWLETQDQSHTPTLRALAESLSNPNVGDNKELIKSLLSDGV